MKKILLYFFATMAVAFTACNDPFDKNAFATDATTQPAATYMEQHDSLNVSMWVDVLKKADMFNTLNLQSGYTCFVPDNNAVKAYLTKSSISSVADMSKEQAQLLVRYHTIPNAKYSSVDFVDGLIADSTATGDYLSTTFVENGGAVQINTEAVINKTVKVTNAYIHIIDAMLTPVTETIWKKLQANDFSIFKSAVEATGFSARLDSLRLTEIVNNYQVNRRYRYTLFVVPNSVYNAAGITSLSGLVASLGAGSNYTSADNALYKYVAYHLLNQQIAYYDLSYFAESDKVRSKNISTMATNQLINITEKNKTIYINYDATTSTGVALTQINRNCKNGVVHIVDGVMPVKSPKPTTVTWELTDYAELSSVPSYRVAAGSSSYTYYLSDLLYNSYKWQTVPESRSGVFYFISDKNNSVLKSSLYSDYLVISLGMYGWIEMQSPAIVAGKYNVYLKHYNPLATDKQGKLSFIFDGAYLGGQITTIGNSKTSNSYLKTLIGQITFGETTTHKLRILSGDTSSSYLDCLTFEPVN